jgi:hypothetical protein
VYEYFNRMKAQNLRELFLDPHRTREAGRHGANFAPKDGETPTETKAREEAAAGRVESFNTPFCCWGSCMAGPRKQRWQPVITSLLLTAVTALFVIFEGPDLPGPRLVHAGGAFFWSRNQTDWDDHTTLDMLSLDGYGYGYEYVEGEGKVVSDEDVRGYPVLAMVQIALSLAAVAAIMRIALSNPGLLLPLPMPSVDSWPADTVVLEAVNGVEVSSNYCWVCHIYKPPGAAHCQDCGICVEGMDHHCPFVGTCIGYLNYPKFLTMVYLVTLATVPSMAWSVYVLAWHLTSAYRHVMAFVCAGLAMCAACFTGTLCVTHGCLLLKGISTRQFWLGEREEVNAEGIPKPSYREPKCCGSVPQPLPCCAMCCMVCMPARMLSINRKMPGGRPSTLCKCCPRAIKSCCTVFCHTHRRAYRMTWNWDHRGRDEYFQYITAAQHASLPGGMALVDMIDGADKSPPPSKSVEP